MANTTPSDSKSPAEEQLDQAQLIEETGSVRTPNAKHLIHCLNIIGQVEGHNVLPEDTKTTKYEHVLPALVAIGIPLAVSADVSLIVPSASMTVHPVRTSGLVLGVPQTTIYFSKIQERITGFITSHSRISKARLENMMLNTQEMATDMGTVISGAEAVECGLIDRLGSLRDAIDALYHRIETQELRPSGNAKT